MPKLTKTQEKLQKQFDLHRNYKDVVARTGIEAKRLGQIRLGKVKPTAQETAKIRSFRVYEEKRFTGQQITNDIISRESGFSLDEVKNAVTAKKVPITRKILKDDNSIELITKDKVNYYLMMSIYVNYRTKDKQFGLSKRYQYKMIDTNTNYFLGNDIEGKTYSFRLEIFRIYGHNGLKQKVDNLLDKLLNAEEYDHDETLDELLALVGYE